MRLYRFQNDDNTIDVTIVTDGIQDQKRVFITESPRGIITPGQVVPEGVSDLGSALIALGFNWKCGEMVLHEELVAFAKEKGLSLTISPEGLNELTGAKAVWNSNNLEVRLETTIPQKKVLTIAFPTSVKLAESASRYGEISADKKSLTGSMWKTLIFTLADLGLAAKAELTISVVSDGIKSIQATATV